MRTILCYGIVLPLMFMLITQPGIAFDTKEPVATDPQQLEMAAQKGDARAMYELGNRYENGVGVIQNYVQAHAWYNVAASRGYTEAAKARDAIAKKMTAEQLAEAQKLAINWKPSQGARAADKIGAKEANTKKGEEKEAAKSIWYAAKNGDTASVKELLKQGTDPNIKDKNGYFPLIIAALYGHKDTVEALLMAGADVNMKKQDGLTALMAAALGGRKSVVEALLKKGADVKAANSQGLTAFIMAKRKGYHDIAALLIFLRSRPETNLSSKSVTAMLKEKGLFDKFKNNNAAGFANDFVVQQDGKVVYDRASGLTWQQSGSDKHMNFNEAKEYVAQLNRDGFAGYRDWRLPTLEEAMSLMEPTKMNGNLHIDPKFDKQQQWIWTSDLFGPMRAWDVNFLSGYCDDCLGFDVSVFSVRVVR